MEPVVIAEKIGIDGEGVNDKVGQDVHVEEPRAGIEQLQRCNVGTLHARRHLLSKRVKRWP